MTDQRIAEPNVTEARRFGCQNEQRRHKVRQAGLNGLDYLDVIEPLRLRIFFLGKAPPDLKRENVRILGGERVRDIQVTKIRMCTREESHLDDCMVVTLDKTGDFSTYTLCLVALSGEGKPTKAPYPGFDIRYSCLDFDFRTECASDLDCLQAPACPPEALEAPDIDYLAKDYAGFRQLILDRLALIMPDWQERHVPDQAIALVEILAYVGDHLSYYQDAVATEAYLHTARRRISVQRHARLVDYLMHEGCNARAWVHVRTAGDIELEPGKLSFVTGYNQALSVTGRVLTWDDLSAVPASDYEAFEPLVQDPEQAIHLYQAHNVIGFWTWGDRECCLPEGATRATLQDGTGTLVEPDDEPSPAQQTMGQQPAPKKQEPTWEYQRRLDLHEGDVLVFEEIKGPRSGDAADADSAHRHVVRLIEVQERVDELYHQPVLDITWAEADALPFPLCLSALGPADEGCLMIQDVSIARGNVVLVDHGRRIDQDLGEVPWLLTERTCEAEGEPTTPRQIAGHYRPWLSRTPVTFRELLSDADWSAPAKVILDQDPRYALPHLVLTSVPPGPEILTPIFPLKVLTSPEALTALAGELRQPKDKGGVVQSEGDQEDAQATTQATHAEQDYTTRYLRGMLSKGTRDDLDAWDGSTMLPGDLAEALKADLRNLLQTWEARRDLLDSGREDPHVVVEVDNKARAHLRFGDDRLGKEPEAGAGFTAAYRVGNGQTGNVGAETISHVVYQDALSGADLQPRNPLPASGGVDPEAMTTVKRFAPHAFRTDLQRAITADDYASIVMRDFPNKVQHAAARLRWNGSWHEVLVMVDPSGDVEATADLWHEIESHLSRYRRIGHDLAVRMAQYVPLDVEMTVCVQPNYLRGHVKAVLLDRFSNRRLPDGTLGFFHPDNLSFGEAVRLSRLVAAAQAVPGVESVSVTKLERMHAGPNGELAAGLLSLGPIEIARLDNDPGFPERGQLKFTMGGGR